MIVNHADSKGNTPLLWAARVNDSACAGLFLEHGASAELKKNTGRTPMVIAVDRDDTDMMRLILRHAPIADLAALDYSGQTLLHRAVSRGRYRSTLELVEMGASLHARNRLGETPLQYLMRMHPRHGQLEEWDAKYSKVHDLITAKT